jgi:FtsP/CotA-like multicopper oxidase with cupredoxin domain
MNTRLTTGSLRQLRNKLALAIIVLIAQIATLNASMAQSHRGDEMLIAQTPPSDLFEANGPVREGDRIVWNYKIVVTETEFRLANGTGYKVFAYGGQVPGPILIAREGDWVRIKLINQTSEPHTIHSHGLFVPQRMDGVPHDHSSMGTGGQEEMNTAPPGGSFTYEYIARPSGTHWYHCHVNTNVHLNRGMSGALIILPSKPEPRVDQDIILLLQEWDSRFAQSGQPGNPRDTYHSDFFTINGKSFPQTPVVSAKVGDVLRFRIINAGGQLHSIHLHGHTMLVTHKDGIPLPEPLEMDTVAVAPGERVDFLVRTNNPGEWPVHCHIAAHQTNGGAYPGGEMFHLLVGDTAEPSTGTGPIGPGTESLRRTWRQSARCRLGIECK